MQKFEPATAVVSFRISAVDSVYVTVWDGNAASGFVKYSRPMSISIDHSFDKYR